MGFKPDFKWGAATASYQIEGGAYQDGKGLSVWDMFCKWEGKVFSGNTGDTACDSYNRVEEDIELIKNLGLGAYRFSISWSRVIPDGIGQINRAGIDYYRTLLKGLIDNGIKPYVTLYHWDLPYELHKKGGWMNRESSMWFEYYTQVIVEELGDLIENWITFNEPEIFVGMGYYTGQHAPGLKVSPHDLINIIHNVLLAHGVSLRLIKSRYPNSRVGIAPTGPVGIPYTNKTEDLEIARKVMFDEHLVENVMKDFPTFSYALFCDPVFTGKYPEWVYKELALALPETHDKDMEIISTEIDFLGCNIYNGGTWKADEDGAPLYVDKEEGYPLTGFNWPVTPKALYYGPKFLFERYKKPILITENGLSQRDWKSIDGKVYDHTRIDFLTRYLRQLKEAVKDGVDVEGYFCWSLMDNFEWAEGYKERFGLVYIDYASKERTPKESYYWYKHVIETNGEEL